ncbi:hypothetical protein [Tenacibaculum aiptasiae]|uniref:hypothetical protein n=1 Tax=Tenacibaculum aiptasiae TaxID=426481 RepID=UPI00232DD889|nr:hypothetical protein [Tenacibaculum aiptasiae]
MKRLALYLLSILLLPSCVSKKYLKKHGYSSDIISMVEKTFTVENGKENLISTKTLYFTKNGRVKTSKTIDSKGNTLEETEKKLWFEKRSYPNKEPYYCKMRWKTKQRERISCYTQKQYKKNEIIVYHNDNGLINKIEDRFTTFYTHQYKYTNKELSKIIITDKEDKSVDTILVSCKTKDSRGNCIKQTKESTKTGKIWVKTITPVYK